MKAVERFLEREGAHGLQIVFEQVPQLGGLPDGEVGPALQEAIPGILENGFVAFVGELFGFLPPHFVDSFAELLGNVETIEHVERGGQHRGDDVEVGFPHVGTDDFDFSATLRSEGLEEAGKGLCVTIPDDPKEAFAPAVDLIDEGHVFVPFAVGDLIDTDGGDVLQIAMFQAEIDDPFYRPADRVPVCQEAGSGFLPTHAPGVLAHRLGGRASFGLGSRRPFGFMLRNYAIQLLDVGFSFLSGFYIFCFVDLIKIVKITPIQFYRPSVLPTLCSRIRSSRGAILTIACASVSVLGLTGCQSGDVDEAEPSEVVPSESSPTVKGVEEVVTDESIVSTPAKVTKVIVGREIRPSADEVIQLGNKVADWQIKTFDEHHKYRGIPAKWLGRESAYRPYGVRTWHMGTFYTGLYEWYLVSEDSDYNDFLIEIGERNEWKLQEKGSMNPYYADGHAVAQFYFALYEDLQRPEMIAPTKERFDWILENPKTGSLEWSGWGKDKYRTDCHYRWGWCDALFMAPPVWARLANATRDRKYLDFMDQEFLATYEILWDKEAQLFWRDTSYFDQREANGEKVFWSRGNGWVFGGLALLIPELSEAWERRESYIKLYRVMAESIRKTQRPDGSWSMGMLGDVEQYPEVETSGTAFFTYGLAWGINEGLLDAQVYESSVLRGWDVLAQCVTQEGMLGYVQPVGASPGQSFADKTEVFGTGAFLAAAAEMYRLVSSPPKVAQPVTVDQPVADAGFIPRPAVAGELSLEESYESGENLYHNSGNRPVVVELPDARSGKYVLQSQISATTENKYRTETTLNKKDLIFEVGKEYWVGLSIRLGEDFSTEMGVSDQGMLMQFHYFDWKHPDVPDAQPLLLRYIGDGQVIVDNEVFRREETQPRRMATVSVEEGEWVDWVINYKIDDTDGIIRIWRNGEQVVDFTGDNHQIEKHDGAYLKFGLYSAQFNPKKSYVVSKPEGATRTVYHDEIRIAGADGSYELVAPGGDFIRPISSKR